MALFDTQDLKDYLTGVTVDDIQLGIIGTITGGLIEAYLGFDPNPSPSPFTATLSMEYDFTVRLPRLVETVTSVKANGVNVQYVRHGDTITVASATFPTSYFLVWVNDRTVDVTYTYTTVPAPLKAAALLTAATLVMSSRSSVSGGFAIGMKSEAIDDYTAVYGAASDLFGSNGLPAQATALLAPYRRSSRSVKLRTPNSAPVGP